MSSERALRGGCHCGRNRYIIQAPSESSHVARVLFNSTSSHRISQASPLTAWIRVPLAWYHSSTMAFFPDETSAMIRRVYTSPREEHAMRHFCGFCGTPLSYWSEEPRTEAEYIQLALGSLCDEDLGDLEDLGLIPDSDTEDGLGDSNQAPATPPADSSGNSTGEPKKSATEDNRVAISGGRETLGGLPWFDSLMEGSRLGKLRMTSGSGQSRDGTTRVQWEVVEYTEGNGDDDEDDASAPRNGKRKLVESEGPDLEAMEGIQH